MVELMLASLLGSILLAFLLRCYCDMRLESQKLVSMADVQQRGRFLSYYFSRGQLMSKGSCLHVREKRSIVPSLVKSDMVSFCVTTRAGAQIPRCEEYFLAKTSRRGASGQRLLSLYVRQPGRRRSELVSGVVRFEVRYWVDRAAGLELLPASMVQKWSNVRVVEMVFLLESLDPVVYSNQSYWMLGQEHQNHSAYKVLPWVVDVAL